MHQLPVSLLDSLKNIKGFDREAFEEVHASGEQITSIRINPLKWTIENCQLSIDGPVPWTEFGYYLPSRPSFTFDPLFHAGCYYVQEAGSMFLEQALKQAVDLSKPLKILDLCAAPGGKSTHIQSLIAKDSLLVSNEVIRSRVNILKDNSIKWGGSNVVVTCNDPKDFSKLENYFDVIVIDAPCSGSGLFRREPEAIHEWSESNVKLCSRRQQRILADVSPALKSGGILIYSTCSYSGEEDEDIAKWIMDELKIENQKLKIKSEWGIIETEAGYRFWPDKVKGEGFFISCFRKSGGEENHRIHVKYKPTGLTRDETAAIGRWIDAEGLSLIKKNNTVYAIPEDLLPETGILLSCLRVIYSGIITGELIRDKLVPGHALAMSKIVSAEVNRISLTGEQAINYLKRKDIDIRAEKGWQLAMYEGYNLGWVNVLSNRINNYYPKELRILKDN